MDIKTQQMELARDLEQKLVAAVAANDALREFERTTTGLGPNLAFGPLDGTQVARWRGRVNVIELGLLSV